jgi:serine-type D-Ala-D-Ala carboxypeptidase (penicillin-binding protein 5/6)
MFQRVRFAAIFCLICLACLCLGPEPSTAGAQDSGAYQTKAPRAILIDHASGAVLFQKNADELAPPASMSKLMTLEVLFKTIKAGTLKLTDEIEMSVNAWKTGGAPSGTSAMMVPVNTKVTVEQLIRGIAIQSGNDASIAIAEAIAGGEEAYARLMTEEARAIGMERSTFSNATGLTEDGHLMTARDLATLARHIITTYPEQYKVFGEKEFTYRTHKFINRNPLLFLDLGVDGLKTGHTKEAGFGLVFSAVKDGQRLVGVVSGLPDADSRKSEAARLIEWGYSSISRVKLFGDGDVVAHARVWGGSQFYVPLTGKGDVMMSLPKYPANQKLNGELMYSGPLKPPVKKGDQVAMLRVTSTSSSTADIPLFAAEDVEPAGVIGQGFDALWIMAVRLLPL